MVQKANPKLIGIFILAAFFIFIATFLLINQDRFFSRSIKYVMYFQGSIKGLNVGSPVVFNGVPIGRVIGISLVTDRNFFGHGRANDGSANPRLHRNQ